MGVLGLAAPRAETKVNLMVAPLFVSSTTREHELSNVVPVEELLHGNVVAAGPDPVIAVEVIGFIPEIKVASGNTSMPAIVHVRFMTFISPDQVGRSVVQVKPAGCIMLSLKREERERERERNKKGELVNRTRRCYLKAAAPVQ